MKIQPYPVLLMAMFPPVPLNGQVIHRPVFSPYTRLGAYSLQADVFSFTANPASLARLEVAAAGVYAERRFLLDELNYLAAVAGLPIRSGNFGCGLGYSGFSEYNETQLGLAYARRLGSKMDIGARFNYNGIRIAGYGSASAISAEAGVVLHLTEKLHTGFHINNPAAGWLGRGQDEKLPSVYTVGVGYDVSDKCLFHLEIIKEETLPVNVNAGLQYELIPQLMARGGIATSTSLFWVGLGFWLNDFRAAVTISHHPQLGITPGLLLLFQRTKKEK